MNLVLDPKKKNGRRGPSNEFDFNREIFVWQQGYNWEKRSEIKMLAQTNFHEVHDLLRVFPLKFASPILVLKLSSAEVCSINQSAFKRVREAKEIPSGQIPDGC